MARHLLFEIANPDYGPDTTDTTPQYIYVNWDDATNAVVADYAPLANFSHGRNGEISPYKFCSGTTLNEFSLTITYPYAVRVQTPNSPVCVVNTVCDAYIYEPLLIKHANGNDNGRVTIRGYSSAFGLEYAVTGEGLSPYPTWQSTPVFSLPPGTYTAHIKDAQGCEDEKWFSIEDRPVYGSRFYASYYDALGERTSINILKRDYDGDGEDVIAGDDPLQIKEGGETMFTVLRGQEAVISLQCTTPGQYLELFTGDDREFLVEIRKGPYADLFWTGWLVPDMYMEPYIAPPYNMSFSATDGLGELKEKPFTEEIPEGFMSQWDAIVHILSKIETRLSILEGINLYETRMNRSEGDSPLRQAFVSAAAYYDGKKVLDCASVLEAILKPYGAHLRQAGGAWYIFRTEEIKGSFPLRINEWHGPAIAWFEFSPQRLITRANVPDALHWIERSQALELRPAFKETSVHIDYGLMENVVKGGDFKENDFDSGWNHKYIDGPAIYSVVPVDTKEKTYAMQLLSASSILTAQYVQTERIWVKADSPLSVYFKFEYQVTGPAYGGQGMPPEFIFSVTLNDKHLNYPLTPGDTNNLEWRAGVHKFAITTTELNKWQTAEFFVPDIPEDGWLTIRVYEVAANAYTFINLLVKRVVAFFIRTEAPALATEETFTATNPKKLTIKQDTVEATHGDVIPLGNAPAMYRNIILVNGTNPSLDWQRRGKFEATPLLQLLANTQLSLRKSPVKVLRGTLRGSFAMNQVLMEADGTRYFPITLEYNDRQRTISGEFMELLGTGSVPNASYYLLETGDYILTETGGRYQTEG
jgi:hypothetical protein